MFSFYKKTIKCGCMIISISENKENDIIILNNHNYIFICNECELNISEEILFERLENMRENDNKLSNNEFNGWNIINKFN